MPANLASSGLIHGLPFFRTTLVQVQVRFKFASSSSWNVTFSRYMETGEAISHSTLGWWNIQHGTRKRHVSLEVKTFNTQKAISEMPPMCTLDGRHWMIDHDSRWLSEVFRCTAWKRHRHVNIPSISSLPPPVAALADSSATGSSHPSEHWVDSVS